MHGAWRENFIPAGSVLGSVTAGELQDRIGRRFSLMVGSIASGIAVSLIFFSHFGSDPNGKRTMFTVGITIQGYLVSIIKVVRMTYVSENAPTGIRGSAMGLFPTFNLLGQLIGVIVLFIVNYLGTTGYLGAFGSQWVLSLAPFIISCVMPEPGLLRAQGRRCQWTRTSACSSSSSASCAACWATERACGC